MRSRACQWTLAGALFILPLAADAQQKTAAVAESPTSSNRSVQSPVGNKQEVAPVSIVRAASAPVQTSGIITVVVPSAEKPSIISKLLSELEKVAKILAVIVGGAWVYFNFLEQRTFKPKLEVTITATLQKRKNTASRAVLAHVSLKNVGLSKVQIVQEGTAFIARACAPSTRITASFINREWITLGASDIFAPEHQWIEPGETINQERLVFISSDDYAAFRLDVRIVAQGNAWNATTTVMSDKFTPHTAPGS